MIIEHSIMLAYIDPGTGALLLQTLIAGFLGVMFYFRAVLKKFVSLIFRRGRKDSDDDKNLPKHKGGAA